MSYKMAEKMLQEWAKEHLASLDPYTQEKISQANADLYGGPLYLDDDNEECSCFDEGARRFDFSSAVAKIADALESISDVWVDIQSGEVLTSEPDWDAVDTCTFDGEEAGLLYDPSDYVYFSCTLAIRAILGKELAKYIA